jgi:hypothetical protein
MKNKLYGLLLLLIIATPSIALADIADPLFNLGAGYTSSGTVVNLCASASYRSYLRSLDDPFFDNEILQSTCDDIDLTVSNLPTYYVMYYTGSVEGTTNFYLCPDPDDGIEYNTDDCGAVATSTATTTIVTILNSGTYSFGIAVIVALLSMIFISLIYNRISSKKKVWQK